MSDKTIRMETNISAMRVGEIGYTVPWVIRDEAFLIVSYPVYPDPRGTADMKVERVSATEWLACGIRVTEWARGKPTLQTSLTEALEREEQLREALRECEITQDFLRAALREYGDHSRSCVTFNPVPIEQDIPDCDCGFDEIRELAKERVQVKDPFGWMEGWLKAYDKDHVGQEPVAEKIMDWLLSQSMEGG